MPLLLLHSVSVKVHLHCIYNSRPALTKFSRTQKTTQNPERAIFEIAASSHRLVTLIFWTTWSPMLQSLKTLFVSCIQPDLTHTEVWWQEEVRLQSCGILKTLKNTHTGSGVAHKPTAIETRLKDHWNLQLLLFRYAKFHSVYILRGIGTKVFAAVTTTTSVSGAFSIFWTTWSPMT